MANRAQAQANEQEPSSSSDRNALRCSAIGDWVSQGMADLFRLSAVQQYTVTHVPSPAPPMSLHRTVFAIRGGLVASGRICYSDATPDRRCCMLGVTLDVKPFLERMGR